jgi:hypothetical protein
VKEADGKPSVEALKEYLRDRNMGRWLVVGQSEILSLRRLREAASAHNSPIATMRSSRVSRAFHTSPIPPAPSGARVSYGPSFVPAASDIAFESAYRHGACRLLRQREIDRYSARRIVVADSSLLWKRCNAYLIPRPSAKCAHRVSRGVESC